MDAQDGYPIDRDSVPVTVSAGGGGGDDQDPPDELAARRRFNALIAPHLPALRTRAGQLCRSHYDPDDVLQDALLRAFLARDQIRDQERARAWLLRIVATTFIDLTRKRRRRPDHVPLVADVAEPEPSLPSQWDHIGVEDVRNAAAQLPDDVRDTYRMFAFEGRDYAAIAKAQQIPAATVGSRIFRARKQLRALLTTSPPEDSPGRGAP